MSLAPLLLEDGASCLDRACDARPHVTTSKGRTTGAVTGVVDMLIGVGRR